MTAQLETERQTFLLAGLGVMIVCSLLGCLLPKLSLQQARSLHFLTVLVGGFVVVGFVYPWGRELLSDADLVVWGRVVAVAIFFGLLALFRLMGKFESPA